MTDSKTKLTKPQEGKYSTSELKEMLLGVANDFNNLLVGIIGNARFLIDEKFVRPAGVGLINEIINCAERCTRLTGKLHRIEDTGEISLEASVNESEGALQLPKSLINKISDRLENLSEYSTVLVIDDEEVVRNVASAILERAGYKVIATGSGKEGIEIFENLHPHIHSVLLDLTMPYIRGNLVFARLKAIDPEVQVFLMSGYSDRQVMREFDSEGIAGLLKKPFEPEDLVAAINSVSPSVRRGQNSAHRELKKVAV